MKVNAADCGPSRGASATVTFAVERPDCIFLGPCGEVSNWDVKAKSLGGRVRQHLRPRLAVCAEAGAADESGAGGERERCICALFQGQDYPAAVAARYRMPPQAAVGNAREIGARAVEADRVYGRNCAVSDCRRPFPDHAGVAGLAAGALPEYAHSMRVRCNFRLGGGICAPSRGRVPRSRWARRR